MRAPSRPAGDDREPAARLFVALELPAAVRANLAEWARTAVVPAVDGARVVPEASLHVTLCFLGARPVGEVEAIAAALASVPVTPVALGAGELVWLPPRRPRVCALTLTDHTGAAIDLQAAVSARLAAGGWYAPERRRFLPHVTIARMRSAPRRGRASAAAVSSAAVSSAAVSSAAPSVASASVATASLAAPSLPPFAAEAVVLYRSWPGSTLGGSTVEAPRKAPTVADPSYEALARVALPAA